MDNNHDTLELDDLDLDDLNLEDILQEFQSAPEENGDAPAQDLPFLQNLQEPAFSLAPQFLQTEPQNAEPDVPDSSLSLDSLSFSPEEPPREEAFSMEVTPTVLSAEDTGAFASADTDADVAATTRRMDSVSDEVSPSPVPTEKPTISVPVLAGETEDAPPEPIPQDAPPESGFVPPSPTAFTPRSRLRELKKKLVSGPERRYYELEGQGLGRLQLAIFLNFLLVLGCAAITTMFKLDMYPESRLRLVIFSQVLAMMISGLLSCNMMLDSLGALFKGRFTVNTLLTITFAACFADGIFCLKELRVPCCAAFCLESTMALWARYHRHTTEMAQMDTMRKAVRLHGIVKVPKYYKNMSGLLRKDAEVEDFMEHYDRMAGPELVQSVYAGLSLLVCIAIAIYAGIFHSVSMGVQIFATALLVAVPASFFLSITRPMALLENRLHMVGSVLCGWSGVKGLCGKAAFPLTDLDLFPQGSTKLNGLKFYSDRDPDEVVAYTTALINQAGGGLAPVFQQLLTSRNAAVYEAENFRSYDGGIGGEVHGESVLLGGIQFLQDMGVEIPEGTMVNQAVYAAIDGQLCAVYAMNYSKMRSAAAGLVTLCGYRKLTPILMGSDFTLTESFLRGKFNVKTKRMVFPNQEQRAQMNSVQPQPDSPVLAISTREELVSSAYLITGARSLRTSTHLAVGIHLVGGILGLLIMAVLAFLGSTELLTPTNVLFYQLIWAIPGLLVTEWTRIV